jgi:hypothetical protein
LLIDHIRFRSSCHYLNDQSHQRNDIGPRSLFCFIWGKDVDKFGQAASLHPYSIYYALDNPNDKRVQTSINIIWSRITSLRRLTLAASYHILATQTGLTWLTMRAFSSYVHHCTNLLELTIPLPLIDDYKSLPTSLTKLNLRLDNNVKWSFDDDNVTAMNNHLPHLTDVGLFGLSARQFVKKGALSSLSRWLSLTKLTISSGSDIEPPSLDALVHTGSSLSLPLSLSLCLSFQNYLT